MLILMAAGAAATETRMGVMRYVISRSRFADEVNRYFMSDVTPRIGKTFEHQGRVYRVIDIECVVDGSYCEEVRCKVSRVI